MGQDRKEYRLNRRKLTTIYKFKTEESYFKLFFPNLNERINTNDLIDNQRRCLKGAIFKKTF